MSYMPLDGADVPDRHLDSQDTFAAQTPPSGIRWESKGHNLNGHQIERYGRHILLNSVGIKAQEKLSNSAVLIIGAGGLGCPAAIYLASSGVGRLGIVDQDLIEISNLHRQILYRETSLGTCKADSAAAACLALNSSIEVVAYNDGFRPDNALELARPYDVIVDATDNASTRYLISDVCCILGKPLISGAAIGTEGQLSVYCYKDGPCYRCLFPQAPAPENCARCSDAGVLGPVPGVIGVMQALEAIKVITDIGSVCTERLLLADFLAGSFHKVKLRQKQRNCVSCGVNREINTENLASYDYKLFTGQDYNDRDPSSVEADLGGPRLSAESFRSMTTHPPILDVRPAAQFDAFHLSGAIHLPYEGSPDKFQKALKLSLDQEGCPLQKQRPALVVCRQGNDSQVVARLMHNVFGIPAMDLEGGLLSLARSDYSLPAL